MLKAVLEDRSATSGRSLPFAGSDLAGHRPKPDILDFSSLEFRRRR